LSELQVPEWQELLAVDRRKWRKMLKSIDIVWYYRRRDTALTNRGLRQKDRGATRVGGESFLIKLTRFAC
jgi:hypothetical protein